jgi:hypothetical protein
VLSRTSQVRLITDIMDVANEDIAGDAKSFCRHFLGNLSFKDLLWWNSMVVQRTLTMQLRANYTSEEQRLWDLLNKGTSDGKAGNIDWCGSIEAVCYATVVSDCLWAMLREEKAWVSLCFIFRHLAKTKRGPLRGIVLRGASTKPRTSTC